MTCCLLAFIVRCGVNLPYMDEWPMVDALASDGPPWGWIFDWHNEHILPLPRFVFWATFTLGHDLRTAMVVSVILWSALARLLMFASRNTRGGPALSDALFPMLLLHPGQFENVLMSYQVCFSLSVFLAGCEFVLMTGGRASPSRAAGVGVCATLLPWCGGHGLLFSLPGLLWLATIAVAGIGGVSGLGRSTRLVAAVGVLASALTATSYLWLPGKLIPSPDSAPGLGFGRFVAGVFGFEAAGYGPAGERFWPATALLPALVWFVVAVAAWRARREIAGVRWTQYLGGVAAVCGVTLMALAVAWGRSRHGLHAVFFPRYVGLAALLPVAGVLFWLRFGPTRIANFATTTLAFLAFVALPFNAWSGWNSGERLAEIQRGVLQDLSNGVPVEVIARQYHHLIYNDPAAVVGFLERYAASGLGPVTTLRHEPPSLAIPLPPPTTEGPLRELEASAWAATGPGGALVFQLDSPRYAHAVVIRGQYRYPAFWPPARATITIRKPGDEEIFRTVPVFRYPTPQLGDSAIILWLEGPVSSVRVSPDDGKWGFRMTSAELLVPVGR
ncbi:MAG: hypothetical protein ACRC8S_12950 [Fimbriiglobus sp.]